MDMSIWFLYAVNHKGIIAICVGFVVLNLMLIDIIRREMNSPYGRWPPEYHTDGQKMHKVEIVKEEES